MICWDHPRIRGTNSSRTSSPLMILGSSPHTRDKFYRMPPHNLRTRIIPAYAGQISGVVCHSPGEQDHPRIRGTNQLPFRSRLKRPGSSPHTRDKSLLWSAIREGSRIIPAYAGQIFFSILLLHPSRIIPAYAGQMGIRSRNSLRKRDHPRIRGTNLCCGLQSVKDQGSSPHTRDKYVRRAVCAMADRIIPAYAGQICKHCGELIDKEDHPRVRGTNPSLTAQG